MANKNPRLENLIPFNAPDLERTGVRLDVRIDPGDKEWLKQLDGGMSYHARQAIALYRKVMTNPELKEYFEKKLGILKE